MFCIQCGNKIPDNSVFCNACGSPTKPVNQPAQSSLGPAQPGRVTVQFDSNGQVVPPQMPGGPQPPVSQFGAAQYGSNPNNPQLPPTQIAPAQFGSNPNIPQYPPNQFASGQQVPPTQIAPTQMSSNPNYPSVPPTQMSSNPNYPSVPPTQMSSNPNNPQYPPVQTGPNQFASGQQVPPMQVAPTQMSSNPNNPQYPPVQTGPNPYGDTASNLQGQSMPYGLRSPYESTQYSSDPNSQPWQVPLPPAAPAAPPPPPAGLQQWLMRTVGPNLASNAIFGVSLGGVLAAVIGAVASLIIISIAHAIAPHVILYNGYYSGEDVVDSALGIVPLHNVFRDAMQLFLVMNGVGSHIQGSSDAYTYTSPLNGLLIIPAIVLTFGGYIAAGTDVKNSKQSSLLRGAAIAIPYTILLFLMTSQANGCVPNGNTTICSTVSTSSNSQLAMDTTSLLLFGVLWGVLFGLLGASIKLARGQWRHMLYQYLRSNARPQLVGALAGSFVAVAVGSMLSLIVVASFIAYTSWSSTLFVHLPAALNGLLNGDWASMTLWTIAQGPLFALNLFFFSMNAPISLTSVGTSTSSTHIAVSLFGTTPSISPWFRLLLAIPVICLFLGGRVSASLGRVQTTKSAGAIQGALIAIPFTVLVMLLTLLSTITETDVSTSSSSSSQFINSAGVGAFDVFLWALLAGAVLGALGGMYQTSSLKASVSKNLAPLAALPASLSKQGYALFARVSKQPNALQHTSTKDWLFSTAFCSLFLLIGAGVVGIALMALNQSLTFDQDVRIRDITSVILIAIPGLLALGTCAVALLREPVPVGGSQSSVSLPVSPPSYPTIQQQPQFSQYPQQPQQSQYLQQPQTQNNFPGMPASPPISQMPQYQQYPQQPQPPQYPQQPQL